ncbi:MAG: hypothetical protein B7Y11_05000 [Sphingobacteriia bacterium 24-36-13]|jgi:hypothetical protein|uniref:AAA family ATPase n=1 Tax=Sediminibacterium sp. TaxID=1917865 RepID=UPI000BCBC37C|nr:AAA family ATPase [Sediminibacterium sp.]OYZ54485.1 MAG: hypothetical protein B7Y11_05000 [Sphingobacteriia bacterium 24-36-13]OZA65494.1 MAG: hypothetical protein B7X68_03915 [Sphingobacteriia bacterium 39-36-14]HQS23882.1 AAA family ATPase [Sediminibacterium sp.]HQS34444.1 AAA family ATPase [Sediminibacterium sp.]
MSEQKQGVPEVSQVLKGNDFYTGIKFGEEPKHIEYYRNRLIQLREQQAYYCDASRGEIPKDLSIEIQAIETILGESAPRGLDELIAKCKIDLSEPLEPPPVAMQIMSDGRKIALFTKGNFSIVTGAAKSRKSFLVSMLMATAIKGEFSELFFSDGEGVNLLFDTEQSRYKAQQIGKRITTLTGAINETKFNAYSLRTLEPSERMSLIDEVLKTTENVNFVAIDGIVDLEADPILEAKQAQSIITKLLQWTENYNIHIVCVLHYNKTTPTLLGHLGSFSHRKADAVIEVSKNKEDKSISEVRAIDCREIEFSPFAYQIDNNGLPYILEGYSFEKAAKEKKAKEGPKKVAITPFTIEQQIHDDILTHVFKANKEQGYAEFQSNIKNSFNKATGQTIGFSKARDFVSYYLAEELVIKVEMPRRNPIYTLAGQKVLNYDNVI